MRTPLQAGVVVLALALIWGLPSLPWVGTGGTVNYRGWTWGLYAWLYTYDVTASYVTPARSVRAVYPTGLACSVAASALVAAFGALWVWRGQAPAGRQRTWGFLVVYSPCVILAAQLWWPDVRGMTSKAGEFYHVRGNCGYLLEAGAIYDPWLTLPPAFTAIRGRVALDPTGFVVNVVATILLLAGGDWLGRRAGRLGLSPSLPAEETTGPEPGFA